MASLWLHLIAVHEKTGNTSHLGSLKEEGGGSNTTLLKLCLTLMMSEM